MAFSAATIFALGADEIFMHPHASLGPIDPQISTRLADGSQRLISYEDLGGFIRWLKDEVGLADETLFPSLVDRILQTIEPAIIGGAKRHSDLSSEVGFRLLSMHMSDATRAKQIATNLNKSFFAHGDAVSRSRAKQLDLQLAAPDSAIETLIWEAFLGLESHMALRTPMNHLRMVLANPELAASLSPRAPVQLPPNSPPELVQGVWNAVAQQAIGAAQQPGRELAFRVPIAVVESTRLASETAVEGKIFAFRQPNGQVQMSVTEAETGWQPVTVTSPSPDTSTTGLHAG